MNFGQAFELMKQGVKVKLPNWAGYWAWENGTIMMHNMASDEFMIADPENTPELGGKARMSFGDALKLVKRGMGMRLPQWKEDVVIRAQFPEEDVVIRAQFPGEHSKMTAPYLYVESRFGRVPWRETEIELFSEEWEVVE